MVNVALIQQKSYKTKTKTISKTINMIKKASKKGSNLIVLQELHQNEYFCQSENTKFFKYADDFESDVLFWSKIALKYSIVLVTSLFEKRTNGIYHNTAVVFDKDGSLAGKYRKMHIPHDKSFYEKFYFTPGEEGFKPINTSIGKLGVLICWDQWYPEAARIMCLNGADILIYPTAIGWNKNDSKKIKKTELNAWKTIQKSHAIANSVPLVCVNRIGYESNPKYKNDGILFWGNSFVCDGMGQIKNKQNKKTNIIYSKINYQKTENIRKIWTFYRDRRIDKYDNILKRFLN